jgi:hypothetical protein
MALRASAPTMTFPPIESSHTVVVAKQDIIDKSYGDMGYTPSQEAFFNDDSKLRHIIGDPGSGKTFAALIEALWHSIAYPGNQGAIFCLNPKDVGCSLFNKAARIFPEGICHWDTRLDTVSINESSVLVLDVSKRQSVEHCRSMNLGWLMFEHPDLYPENVHRDTILRQLRRQDTPKQAWYISNHHDTPLWLNRATTDFNKHHFGYANVDVNFPASYTQDIDQYMCEMGDRVHRNQRMHRGGGAQSAATPSVLEALMISWERAANTEMPVTIKPPSPSDAEMEAFLAKVNTLLDDDTLEEETDVLRSVPAV